jgi:hypothetical protein
MHWARFLLVYGLQLAVTYRRHVTTCQDTSASGRLLYGTHHALDVYLFWAPLFLETATEWRFYIGIATVMLAHWLTYQNRCIATVVMNRRCGFPESQWLDSLKNRLGMERVFEPFHFIWIGAILLYAAGKN